MTFSSVKPIDNTPSESMDFLWKSTNSDKKFEVSFVAYPPNNASDSSADQFVAMFPGYRLTENPSLENEKILKIANNNLGNSIELKIEENFVSILFRKTFSDSPPLSITRRCFIPSIKVKPSLNGYTYLFPFGGSISYLELSFER